MSALPPKAEVETHGADVRYVPLAEVGGAGERSSLFALRIGTVRFSVFGAVLVFGMEARVSAERDPPTVQFIGILRTV